MASIPTRHRGYARPVSVEIFPFVIFGGIAVIAVAGSFRSERGGMRLRGPTNAAARMRMVRDACWVALMIAILGAIVYLAFSL